MKAITVPSDAIYVTLSSSELDRLIEFMLAREWPYLFFSVTDKSHLLIIHGRAILLCVEEEKSKKATQQVKLG